MALKVAFVVSLLCWPFTAAPSERFEDCLPAGITGDMIVLPQSTKATDVSKSKRTSVKIRLAQLKARCKRGKLVDAKGRQIYFYTLIGCWGNPPENYLEQLQHQAEEIQRLKKKYTVIQIPCAQSVDPRTIS